MLPTSTRLIATAALGTVLIAGCSISGLGTEPGPTVGPPSTARSSASAPATTPAPATSIADLTAHQIVEKAEAAAQAAVSVRVRGAMTTDDNKPLKFDLSLTKTAGSGTVTINGAGLKLRVIGRTAYLQGSDAYWRQNTTPKSEADMAVKLMRGKWLKLALTDENFGQLTTFARMSALFVDLFDQAIGVAKTGARTVGGIPCIGLGDAKGNTLWVDATNARPIRLDQPGKSRADSTSFSFSEYNKIREPKAPPAAQVVDGKTGGL